MAPPPDDPGDGPPLDLPRIVQTLDRHNVEYILVGGAAAIAYGAERRTKDVDCVLDHGDDENLDRLGEAMRELGARIRAPGLSDEVARQLPANLEAAGFKRSELSTWMTDAGGFDVLANLPDRSGNFMTFDRLSQHAQTWQGHNVTIRVAGLEDIIASKEWANRPKDRDALSELYAIRDARAATEACLPQPARPGSSPEPEHGHADRPGDAPQRDSGLER